MCSELLLFIISYLISSIMIQSFALSLLLFLISHVSACSHACVHAPCLCPWAMPNACPCRCPRNFKYLWLPVPLLLLTTFVLFILFVAIYVCFLIYSLNMPLAYRVLTPVRKRIRSIPGKVAQVPRGSLLHRYSTW